MKMTPDQRRQIGRALIAWFQSQDIAPETAAPIMVEIAGKICSRIACESAPLRGGLGHTGSPSAECSGRQVMTYSGDDFDDEPRRHRNNSRVKQRAEEMSRREFGDAKDWERFIGEATGSVKWEQYEHHLISEGWQHVETYKYRSHDGQPVSEVLRYQHRLQPKLKKFIPRYKNFDGKLIIGASPVRVPYNLPEISSRSSEPIVHCEGEKAANRAMAAGMVATCVHGQRWSGIVASYYAGRDVYVIPDNDDAGERNAVKVLDYLVKAEARPRLVSLPGLRRNEDLFDWLEAGHTKEELFAIASNNRSTVRTPPR
jgi:hypothetical protein